MDWKRTLILADLLKNHSMILRNNRKRTFLGILKDRKRFIDYWNNFIRMMKRSRNIPENFLFSLAVKEMGDRNGNYMAMNLNRLYKELRKTNNRLRSNMYSPESLSEEERSLYDGILYEASFKDFENGDNRIKFGGQLKTDQKLISMALTLSLRQPVTLISRDNQLLNIFDELSRLFFSENTEIFTYGIMEYKPKFDGRNFMDSERVRVNIRGSSNYSCK